MLGSVARQVVFWATLLLRLRLAHADIFTNPSNSVTDLSFSYTVGGTVQIAWNCSLDYITLAVSHWHGDIVGVLLSDALNAGVFTWTVGQHDNIDSSAIAVSSNFVLGILDPGNPKRAGNNFVNGVLSSRAFVIKMPPSPSSPSSSSSSSPPSSSSSSTSTTTPTSTPTSGTATTSTNLPSTTAAGGDSGSDLSHDAKIGIGVGVGVGSVVLIACTILLTVLILRRRRAATPASPPAHAAQNEPYKVDGPNSPPVVFIPSDPAAAPVSHAGYVPELGPGS